MSSFDPIVSGGVSAFGSSTIQPIGFTFDEATASDPGASTGYSLDGLNWIPLPVGPQFDLAIGRDETDIALETDSGVQRIYRQSDRDKWGLTFRFTEEQRPSFAAFHAAVDGQLRPFYLKIGGNSGMIISAYGRKDPGIFPAGINIPGITVIYEYRLIILGEIADLEVTSLADLIELTNRVIALEAFALADPDEDLAQMSALLDSFEIPDGSVTAIKVAANAIETTKLVNDAVTALKLAADSVIAAKIAVNAIDGTKIQADVINTGHLVDAAITEVKLADDAVTNAKIAVNAIDATQIQNNAVTTAAIVADAVTAVKGATDAITTTKIQNDAITTAKIAALQVTAAKIAANTITAGQIAAGTITATEIAANTITAAKIAALTITAAEIAANTITAAKIAAGTITATEIAASTITAAKIAAGTITANEIAANTITAAKIAALTITGAEIAAGTIVAGKLATDSVVAANIAAGEVTAVKINVSDLSAISANLGSITAGSIDAVDITGGSITGTTYETNGPGNNRVTIDATDGVQLIDSSDITHVEMNAAVYAGIQVNGLRSIDTNDIFMEAQDQSVQLFVSQGSGRVSFAVGVTRGYVDAHGHETGGGNLPSGLVLLMSNSLRRLNCQQGTGPGFGYAYFG